MRLFLLHISLFFFLKSPGQGYKQGDVINDFNIAAILNSAAKPGSFNSLKKDITIIDFFGTWCAPCIKALPLLEHIQQKHFPQLTVVLVSTEKKMQLNNFITAQKNFVFPVIVDEDKAISNLFQPPSYPYTVVVNSNNQVIAVTAAADITDQKIAEWLVQQPAEQKISASKNLPIPENNITAMVGANNNTAAALSAEFIYAAKTGNETTAIETTLQGLNFDDLQNGLKTDDEKKAFWINIYNGYTQLLLKKDPGKYKNRNRFFKAKQIAIAGKIFSLDEIEHDILRRSTIKWSLGYLSKLFPAKSARQLRVDHVDYRIHFALNCGAKSCPPIAFYDANNLESQLDIATKAYLSSEAIYDEESNTLQLPAIMGWFRHDFKGKKNMLLLVKKYQLVPAEKRPAISFKKYNWNLYLNNYKN